MKKVLIIIAIIFLGILFLRFIIGGDEDTWICEKGVWTIHGKPSYPKPVKDCGKSFSLPRNKDDCLKINGVWEKQGPEPFETCDRKTIDRGNLCRDNSECEGMCQVDLTRDEISLGMKNKLNINKKYGQCSVWIVELGCFGMMKQGKTQVICVD